MYKISVILNVNSDNSILESINALTKQTIGFKNLEIILMGKKNFNWHTIEILSNQYPNVYLYEVEENEFNNNKNLALKYATSPFVIFLDSNEVLFSDSCETVYDIINENNCDIVSGNVYIDKDKFENNFFEGIQFNKGFNEIEGILDYPKFLELPPFLDAKIFRRDFLIKNNITFKNNNSVDDLIFVTESLLKANGIIFFNKPLLKISSTKMSLVERSIENNSLFNIIEDLETFYINLNKKFDYTTFLLKYVEEIFEFIISNDFSNSYLLDICVRMNFLVKEYNSSNFEPNKEIELLFDSIDKERYDVSIKLISLLNNKNDFDYSIIKSRDILLLFYGFDMDVGGLAKAVFHRANLLSDKGHKVKLINVDPFTHNFIGENYDNMSRIEKNSRELNLINDVVEFYNILEYYKEINTDKNANKVKVDFDLSKNIQIFRNFIVQKIKDDLGLKVFNFYNLYDFNEDDLNFIKLLFKEPMPTIDKVNLNKILNKSIIKTEYYVEDSLFIKDVNDSNGHTIKEYLYTENGFNFLKIEKESEGYSYALYSINSPSEIIFNNYVEFWDYFIQEICLNCNDKPFLVNDCSGEIPSFNNLSSELAYKIGNIHSNPYLEPTYCYGSPMRIISPLEAIDELDAVVTLTESERIDFIKEFGTDNVFSIPNLIDFDEISSSNINNFEVDKNKISIFARISPEKNMGDLVKAFKIVINKYPQAKLNIYGRAHTIGEKLAFENLQQLIADLKMEDNVIFRGHVNNVYDEMSNSLVTILVSHIEGLGMVIIESMANRTPVISYDTKYGPSDVITNNVDGFIVKKYNISELAEKICYLIENPDIAIEMGKKAQQSIFTNFDSNKIYKNWLNVFKEAYFNSLFNEIYFKYRTENLIYQLDALKNKVEKEKIDLDNCFNMIKKYDDEIDANKKSYQTQNNLIINQKNEIKQLNEDIKKYNDSIGDSDSNVILAKGEVIQLDKAILNLKTTNDYYKLKSNSKKRLLLFLPYLYILSNHKNIFENIKLYRKLINNDWFDIGYYLNTNSDLSRKKWCKLLTPEVHYVCHGFDEKRLPNRDYKNNFSKNELIIKLGDNNV